METMSKEHLSSILSDKTCRIIIDSILEEYPDAKVNIKDGVATVDIVVHAPTSISKIRLNGVVKNVLID